MQWPAARDCEETKGTLQAFLCDPARGSCGGQHLSHARLTGLHLGSADISILVPECGQRTQTWGEWEGEVKGRQIFQISKSEAGIHTKWIHGNRLTHSSQHVLDLGWPDGDFSQHCSSSRMKYFFPCASVCSTGNEFSGTHIPASVDSLAPSLPAYKVMLWECAYMEGRALCEPDRALGSVNEDSHAGFVVSHSGDLESTGWPVWAWDPLCGEQRSLLWLLFRGSHAHCRMVSYLVHSAHILHSEMQLYTHKETGGKYLCVFF